MPNRKILHIDMDCFFAQVEIRDNPKLKDKNVIVAGKESFDIVCAANYNARAYGVKAGTKIKEAKEKCNDLIVVEPNYEKYKQVSSDINNIFKKYTSLVEPIFLDEAFLDVTNNALNETSATKLALIIKEDILNNIGLTCSIGVSYNKFLAKVGSDYNKPSGVTVIPPDKAIEFIDNIKLKDYYGVGEKSLIKLNNFGIYTTQDIRNLEKEKLEKYFGKLGTNLYNIVRGEDLSIVTPIKPNNSIGCERTFKTPINGIFELKEAFKEIIRENILRLNKVDKTGKTITIKIKYNDFTVTGKSVTINHYILDEEMFHKEVCLILDKIKLENKPIRNIGTTLSNLKDRSEIKNEKMVEQINLL